MRVRCGSRIKNKQYKSATQQKPNSSKLIGSKKKPKINANPIAIGGAIIPMATGTTRPWFTTWQKELQLYINLTKVRSFKVFSSVATEGLP